MRSKRGLFHLGRVWSLLAVILLPHAGLPQGSTVTITFDGPPRQPAGTAPGVTSYGEAGASLTPVPDRPGEPAFFILSGGGDPRVPENGTAYVQGTGWPVEFRFDSGSLFGVASLDVAAYSTVVPDLDLSIVGFLAGGATITNRVQGSGIDFRTIQFSSDWASGLQYLQMSDYYAADPTTGWSIDNLVVSVPEPGTGALTVLGAALLGLRLGRRRN